MIENCINLDMPVDLVLSRQYVYPLEDNDIYTIRQLVTKSKEEILDIISHDKDVFDSIEQELNIYGLRLGADIEITPENDKFYDFNKELKNIENKIGKISLLPLKTTLARRQMTKKQLCEKLPILRQYLMEQRNSYNVSHTVSLVTIGLNSGIPVNAIISIAALLNMPISQVVLFSGYKTRDDLSFKYKKVSDFTAKSYTSVVQSYEPLKQTFDTFFYNGTSLENMLNNMETNNNRKYALIERVVLEKEYIYDNLIHLPFVYDICKTLNCNIDYVLGYKENPILNNEELIKKLSEKELYMNTPISNVFELSYSTKKYLSESLNIHTTIDFVLLTEEGMKKWKHKKDNIQVVMAEIVNELSKKGLYSGNISSATQRNIQQLEKFKAQKIEKLAQEMKREKKYMTINGLEVDVDKPIDTLDFSRGAKKYLEYINIHTLGELLSLTEEDLHFTEIITKLAEKGLYLGSAEKENTEASAREFLLQKREEFLNRQEIIKKKQESRWQLERMNKENKEKLEIELKKLKECYDNEVKELKESRIKSKYVEAETFDISFFPLTKLLTEKNLTVAKLCQETKLNAESIHRAIKGYNLLMTETLAKIAAYLRVPISSIVEFNNYEIKTEFATRYGEKEDFEVPKVILGEPSYQPLRDFVPSLYQYKNLTEIFNKVEPHTLVRREKNIKEPKRKHTGISFNVRSKITQDKSINIDIIYKICKLLQCNVDFVFGWK